ncbi:hypothetical protein CIK76_06770 [Glutamicibacter sp. BW80]|nr:hypothetical protein CIK76_06770 [Glutamicibacter sp. BW80]
MPLVGRSVNIFAGRVLHHWEMPATADQVWHALTESAPLSGWLGTLVSGTFRSGEVVTVEHAPNYPCTSQVRGIDPLKLLAMSWKFPDEEPSELRIELTGRESSTGLHLEHRGLADKAADYLIGWHTHLRYLEDLLAGKPRDMVDFWTLYEELARSTDPKRNES